MKIEVELEDYELNGEDWVDELKDYLKTTYFKALQEQINNKIDKETRDQIKEKMTAAIDEKITNFIKERINTQEFYFQETSYMPSKRTTIEDYLESLVTCFSYRRVEQLIAKKCNDFIEMLTKKYDDAYATAIISHLYKNNFLSENLHNLLSKEEK